MYANRVVNNVLEICFNPSEILTGMRGRAALYCASIEEATIAAVLLKRGNNEVLVFEAYPEDGYRYLIELWEVMGEDEY